MVVGSIGRAPSAASHIRHICEACVCRTVCQPTPPGPAHVWGRRGRVDELAPSTCMAAPAACSKRSSSCPFQERLASFLPAASVAGRTSARRDSGMCRNQEATNTRADRDSLSFGRGARSIEGCVGLW